MHRYHSSTIGLVLSYIFTISIIGGGFPSAAHSQVILDGTLGGSPGQVVGPGMIPGGKSLSNGATNTDHLIVHDLGTTVGNNLFHSFRTFDIEAGKSATFTGPDSIANIISRVTGGSASTINGLLASTIDNANVFLMNPNGVIFGPQATIDIKGAFYTTTANVINLGDNGIFHADTTMTNVLTTAPPEAFGFLGPNPPTLDPKSTAAIEIQGLNTKGSDLTVVGRDGLVKETLVPGVKVAMALKTEGGILTMASVASPGNATLGSINIEDFPTQGHITINSGGTIDTRQVKPSGILNGGDIMIQGGAFVMESGSEIDTGATERAAFGGGPPPLPGSPPSPPRGSSPPPSGVLSPPPPPGAGLPPPPPSTARSPSPGLSLPPSPGSGSPAPSAGGAAAEARAGNVIIVAAESVSMDSALIDTKLIRANGQAGTVTITAPTIDMFDTKIRTQAFGGKKGDSGPVTFIATGPETISLVDSEIVTSAENGALNAGDITMTGPSVNVANTEIRAEAQESSGGAAGTINFNVETVTFTDQSFVLSRNVTRTGGQAGSIRIQGLNGPSSEAHVVVLDKQSRLQVSNEDASAGATGGTIDIHSHIVTLTNGGALDARATSGEGGIITVTASEALNISGRGSQITAARKRGGVSGTRSASIELNTLRFTLTGGGLVDTQNNGTFLGGTVTIQGPEGSGTEAESITITGQDGFGNPSKISTATNSQGPGGNIMLHAQQIAVGNGASITASSASQEMRAGSGGDIVLASSGFIFIDEATITSTAQEGTGGNVTFTAQGDIVLANTATVTTKAEGLGNAGDIHFKSAGSIEFADSLVSTLATRADGGNIKLTAVNTIHMIDSMLISSVGGGAATVGGNISLDPQFIILQNSRILANAFEGQGGNISLIGDVIFVDPLSTLDASSALGVSGSVDIQAPIQNLSGTIAPLPQTPITVAALYGSRCVAQKNGKFSSFSAIHSNGIPQIPGGWLPSPLPKRLTHQDLGNSRSTRYSQQNHLGIPIVFDHVQMDARTTHWDIPCS